MSDDSRRSNRKRWLSLGLAAVLTLVGAFVVTKKLSPLSWGWWGTVNTASGVALHGYDPVAYFDAGAAVVGDSAFSYTWNDARWHFASAENRDRFAAQPTAFAPQFGGFCAFAVSKGLTADAAPDAWHIEGGKLYVFADDSVKASWVADIAAGSLQTSVANWSRR